MFDLSKNCDLESTCQHCASGQAAGPSHPNNVYSHNISWNFFLISLYVQLLFQCTFYGFMYGFSAASCFHVATFVSPSMWVKMLIYIAHGDIYLALWTRIHQKGEMHPEGKIAQLFLETHQLTFVNHQYTIYGTIYPDQTNIRIICSI